VGVSSHGVNLVSQGGINFEFLQVVFHLLFTTSIEILQSEVQ